MRIVKTQSGASIAYHALDGARPGVIFCGGFMSDMTGTKAVALEDDCRRAGRAFVRFDYQGHGASSGKFTDGTIGGWLDDTLAVIDQVTEGPQIIVGSSMGGWIALLAALARPGRVAGLVTVAAAPDFTEELMWDQFDDGPRTTLLTEGVYHQPSEYGDEPYAITLKLIEEGRDHLLLGGPIPITCPVRLLHGMRDADVPWRHALRIAEHLDSTDVIVTLVKQGDHRMSEPADIDRLTTTTDTLCRQIEAPC
ncbi:MAG: alpha/beta hydrolase [Sphingomonadales bacterium]